MKIESIEKIASRIMKNPLTFIKLVNTNNGLKYDLIFSDRDFLNNDIFMSRSDNAIDILNQRDSMISEWYGYSCLSAIKKLEQDLLKDDLFRLKSGYFSCFYNRMGSLFDFNLKEIVLSDKRKTVFSMCGNQIKLSTNEISKMIRDNIAIYSKRSKGFFYIEDECLKFSNEYKDKYFEMNIFRKNVPMDQRFMDISNYTFVSIKRTGLYSATPYIKNKIYFFGSYGTPEEAQTVSFDKYKEITGSYHKKDPRSGYTYFSVFETKNNTYESKVTIDGKSYRVGVFSDKKTASDASYDLYFLFTGIFHKSDKRRLNNEI